eukprot:scaffold246573_cov19-Prasinocladus_malaysianus.AAC.1
MKSVSAPCQKFKLYHQCQSCSMVPGHRNWLEKAPQSLELRRDGQLPAGFAPPEARFVVFLSALLDKIEQDLKGVHPISLSQRGSHDGILLFRNMTAPKPPCR